MWRKIEHSSTYSANLARRKFASVGADKIIVINATETMIEFINPNKGGNKKKLRRAKENEDRVKFIVKETKGKITHNKPSPLGLEEWQLARCGLGVLNEKYTRHISTCGRCKDIVNPTPTNLMASEHTGYKKASRAVQEVTDQAIAAKDFNLTQEVKVTQLKTAQEESERVGFEELTYVDILKSLKDKIVYQSDIVVERYGALLVDVIAMVERAVELDNQVQNELNNMDDEIIRKQKELETLIYERDIVTRRAV